MAKKIKIIVGTNSLTESQYPAYTNHCQLWYNFGQRYRDSQFIFNNPSRMSIDRMRNQTARIALESQSDYLLFLDDDVVVEMEGLHKLVACNADIAASKVVIRGYPFDYMIFKEQTRRGHSGLFAQSKLPESGVINCDAVGFSFCLIKTEVLKSLPAPWFITGLNNTEDIYFCVKAREMNRKLKIVCECSIRSGHILWPEIMDSVNRDAYRKYYETINPQVVRDAKIQRRKDRNPRGDRSIKYLAEVKETME